MEKKNIVIVGAGFGGMKLAKLLAKEDVRITLIDRHNFTLFQPLLYQVSTSMLSTDEIQFAHPSVTMKMSSSLWHMSKGWIKSERSS